MPVNLGTLINKELGAVAIIIIFIWRLPVIIERFNSGVQLIINNVSDLQDKVIVAFKEEMTKDREILDKKLTKSQETYEELDKTIQKLIEHNGVLANGIQQILTNQDIMKKSLGE